MRPQNNSNFQLVNIGSGRGLRRDSIGQAYKKYTGSSAFLLTWNDIIDRPEELLGILNANTYIRFDSPDQDEQVRAALYRLGQPAAEAAGLPVLTADAVDSLKYGDIGSPSQLVFGIYEAARRAEALSRHSDACLSIGADDILAVFDKAACGQKLRNAGLPTPKAIALEGGFDALCAIMDQRGMSRVFVKLRHGAAAAGTIALARHREHWVATTTAVIADDGRPYATRSMQRIADVRIIARIVDCLAPLGLQVEQWLPKIGIDGKTVDMRIVVMGGKQTFTVLRSSAYPITNLHIGGHRKSPDVLAQKIGETSWAALLSTTRDAARLFASAQCVGVDMAVLADGKRHSIIEVNAFGDHVQNFSDGEISIHDALMAHIDSVMTERRISTRAT